MKKPKNGDKYYYIKEDFEGVDWHIWANDYIDNSKWNNEKCYRTEEDAENNTNQWNKEEEVQYYRDIRFSSGYINECETFCKTISTITTPKERIIRKTSKERREELKECWFVLALLGTTITLTVAITIVAIILN